MEKYKEIVAENKKLIQEHEEQIKKLTSKNIELNEHINNQDNKIKKLDLDIAQSQTLIKAAQGSYFPEVSLQAGSDVRHRDLGGTKPEWIGGVFMEFPFFEGGLTNAVENPFLCA